MTARPLSRDIIPTALIAGITITAAAALPPILCYPLCRRTLDRHHLARQGSARAAVGPRWTSRRRQRWPAPLQQAYQGAAAVLSSPHLTGTRPDLATQPSPRQGRLLPKTSGAQRCGPPLRPWSLSRSWPAPSERPAALAAGGAAAGDADATKTANKRRPLKPAVLYHAAAANSPRAG